MTTSSENDILVYVGTYTKRGDPPPGVRWTYQGRGEGIYIYRFNLETGQMTHQKTVSGVVNPSYMAIDPQARYLFAVSQVVTFGETQGGAVNAFAIDADSGDLTFLNQQPSHGTGPCHLTVDRTGKFLVVANYRSGTAAIFPIQQNGHLAAASDTLQHQGSSVNPDRQEGPHAHSATIDPSNQFVYIADLGIDKMMIYRLEQPTGRLIPNDPPYATLHAGAGPRHFAFHPNGQYAYVINELDSTVTAFAFDGVTGTLTETQTLSTLPEDFDEASHCADIHVHPTGRFLYGSNRGHDSIVIYAIEAETGRLTLLGHESTQGQSPRNFSLDPTGQFLLAANQNTDNVVIFRIDSESGLLTPTGQIVDVPSPVCIKMLADI